MCIQAATAVDFLLRHDGLDAFSASSFSAGTYAAVLGRLRLVAGILPSRTRSAQEWQRDPLLERQPGLGDRFTEEAQRHINGVVSKNEKYNMFGFGGIKQPF